MAQMSSKGIPQVSMVLGSCTAGGAYVPAMADEKIIVEGNGTIFLAGPPLVKAATGEVVSAEELRGGAVYTRISGVSDHLSENEEHVLWLGRNIAANLNTPKVTLDLSGIQEPLYHVDRPQEDFRHTRAVLTSILDDSKFEEYKREYGRPLVTGFGRTYSWQVRIKTKFIHMLPAKHHRAMVSRKYQLEGIFKHKEMRWSTQSRPLWLGHDGFCIQIFKQSECRLHDQMNENSIKFNGWLVHCSFIANTNKIKEKFGRSPKWFNPKFKYRLQYFQKRSYQFMTFPQVLLVIGAIGICLHSWNLALQLSESQRSSQEATLHVQKSVHESISSEVIIVSTIFIAWETAWLIISWLHIQRRIDDLWIFTMWPKVMKNVISGILALWLIKMGEDWRLFITTMAQFSLELWMAMVQEDAENQPEEINIQLNELLPPPNNDQGAAEVAIEPPPQDHSEGVAEAAIEPPPPHQ